MKRTEIMFQKIKERKREDIKVRKIVLIMTLVGLAVMVGVFLYGFSYVKNALEPADLKNKNSISVNIPSGSGTTTITKILEKNGIIKNAKIYKYYLKLNNHSDFKAGDYQLSPSMSLEEITDMIEKGQNETIIYFKLTIPEGKQLEEIAELMGEKIGMDKQTVFDTLNDPDFVKKMQTEFPNLLGEEIFAPEIKYPLEGYLFPATYPYYEETPTVEEMVRPMLKKMSEVVDKYRVEFGDHWTVHLLLTISSIVEEESTDKTDRTVISSVFNNRIAIDMRLQSDPTVLYALGEHREKVSIEDTQVDSPYNTYKYEIPPGPIAAPGEKSIEATLRPAETNYLYFIATPAGDLVPALTYEQHLANVEQYLR